MNLSTAERGNVQPGRELKVFGLATPTGRLQTAAQICRELRFPEPWRSLALEGAQLLVHLNNAVGDADAVPVWRSHLVSRAAENQRFVASANTAHAEQRSPSLIAAPDGRILAELPPGTEGVLRAEIDLSEVSDHYLTQRRDDLTR